MKFYALVLGTLPANAGISFVFDRKSDIEKAAHRSGRVIGFEKLNFLVPESDSVHVALETAPA